MKNLILTILGVFTFATFSFSQDITGEVIDKKGDHLQFARIKDANGKLLTVTDTLGQFSVNLDEATGFEVEFIGFESKWISKSSIRNNHVIVVLNMTFQNIEEVTVTNEKYREALDLYSVNIIDYRPFNGYLLTLKKYKYTYYVGIDSIGTEGMSSPFTVDRPKKIFEDCLGNVHLVCKDKVYQFYFVDSQLVVLDPISITDFETGLKPCRGVYDNTVVYEKLTVHNKKYDLTLFERDSLNPKVIFSQFDIDKAVIAEEIALYLGIQQVCFETGCEALDRYYVRNKMREIHKGANPDINFAMTVQASGSHNVHLIAQYMMASWPVDVRTFQIGNYIAVIDFLVDSVLVFNQYGKMIVQNKFNRASKIKDVWQDFTTGEVYLFAKNGGTHELYKLDLFTGNSKYIIDFKEISFTTERKISDGWLYFKKLENGYNKVYRMKLPV